MCVQVYFSKHEWVAVGGQLEIQGVIFHLKIVLTVAQETCVCGLLYVVHSAVYELFISLG